MAILRVSGNDALFVAPKPALFDWLNTIFPDSPMEYLDPLGNDNSTIYLIPDFLNEDKAIAWLKKNFKQIFHEELFGWCEDESLFPPLTWKNFNTFCIVSYQSVVKRANASGILND